MASAKRFSFITKYFVVMMAMSIVPKNIMSSLVDANDSSIIIFQEGKDAKERMPEVIGCECTGRPINAHCCLLQEKNSVCCDTKGLNGGRSAPEFFFGNVASDCILDELVDTESNCRWAARMLGKEYMNDSKGPHYDWPAGCYYRSMSDDVHFNTILDPSGTNNLQYSSKGVCVKIRCQTNADCPSKVPFCSSQEKLCRLKEDEANTTPTTATTTVEDCDYKIASVISGCCISQKLPHNPALNEFHERCHCRDVNVFQCKYWCDQDANCKGYVEIVQPYLACNMATTSNCPPQCRKVEGDIGNVDEIDQYGMCGDMGDYLGCYIKCN